MMRSLRRLLPVALVAAVLCAPVAAQDMPPPVDEFIPIDELPQAEQIPAANLLIPAYAFVWLAVLGYVVTVARRLGAVEKDVQRLESDLKAKK